MNYEKTVVVIGGGPSGTMSAGTAAVRGNRVILLERNEKLGKKLYITGKGRCNITNACSIDEFLENIPRNPKFLYSAIYSFTDQDLMAFFNKRGLDLKIERGNRVFPRSDKSSDVIKVLEKYIRECGVEIVFGYRVEKILQDKGTVIGVQGRDGKITPCQAVILCTGGISYPSTGSIGDGYKMACELGHSLVSPIPSLVSLVIKEGWVKELQGLSLRNVRLSCRMRGKILFSEIGEMIFTHYGISGPLVLSLSSHIIGRDFSKLEIILDLKPGLSEEQLDKRILRDFDKFSRKQYKNALNDLFPQKIIPTMIRLSGISADKQVHQISKEERKRLVTLSKGLIFHIERFRPVEEAIVTRGGIPTKEINPSTMESRLIKGLFFAGEIIDVDGYTGGFNLQIAFSTGYLAGSSC
ncbi:MAG: NAD(P)/FAD-dependent oxidoreductase [Clostridia bacterium]|jgi:predicted Rossmann fold flavoprotein